MKYDPEYQRTDSGEVLCEPRSGWICHDSDNECSITEPHFMDQCQKFLPPRYEVPEEKKDRVLRMVSYTRFFEGLEKGKSIFEMLKDPYYSFTSRVTT